jgi:hypothetical protein
MTNTPNENYSENKFAVKNRKMYRWVIFTPAASL